MTDKSFAEMFAEAEASPAYHVEGVVLAFTDGVQRRMAAQGVSRAELARRLGTSQAYVTKLFNGSANFTVETMVKIAMALGTDLEIGLARPAVAAWPEDLASARRRRVPEAVTAPAPADFGAREDGHAVYPAVA
ncbi:MAG: helix-turn-helix transcriptional regulator [Azospirillaceae bacterium]